MSIPDRDPQPLATEELSPDPVRSRADLHAALDTLLVPHVMLAPVCDALGVIIDYSYVDANQAACEYNGLSGNQLVGSRLLTLFPTLGESGLLAACRTASETGEPQVLDDLRLHNDLQGRARYYDIRIVAVDDHLSLTWRDVSAQREARTRMAEREQRYRMLAEYTSDIVAQIEDGLIQWISPSVTRILGWRPSDVLGRALADFVHPDDVGRLPLSRPLGELVTTLPDGLRVRCRMRNDGGRYRWFDVSGGVMRDDLGAYAGVVASARLIDEQVQAELDLIRAREDALASARAKAAFLANMSHEIRTPLTAVLGLLGLLEGSALSVDQAGYVERANRSANVLLSLLNDVLDYSKIDAGALMLHAEPVSLRDMVAEIGDIIRTGVGDKRVEVRTDIDDATPDWVEADPLRLRQVILNLGSNAIKFTPEGAVTLRLEVLESDDRAARVRLAVSDTGIGIDTEAQARIFEGFTQAEATTTRRFGGTGLGLTISRELVRLMGSDLEVDSAVGAGSTFSFVAEFPLSAAGPRPDRSAPGVAAEQPALRLDGVRILLVEDNEINIEIEAEMLRREGALVWLARDGAAAAERAGGRQGFDAVLMDVQMPVLDGLEATRRIRDIPRLAGLPVIALTAYSSSAERDRCLGAGMNDYLHKPFDLSELTAAIRRWVGLSVAGQGDAAVGSEAGSRWFDGDAALARLGGDRAFYARVLDRFLENLGPAVDALVQALRGEDPASAASLAHALKGSAATVGATGLADAASEAETTARDWTSFTDVEGLVRNLGIAAARVRRDADEWL